MQPSILSVITNWDTLPPVVYCCVWEQEGRRWYGGVIGEKSMRDVRRWNMMRKHGKLRPLYIITVRKHNGRRTTL